jgi:alkylhydroperoxidase family enzyme
MPRIEPVAVEGDAIQSNLLARVLGRRPEVLKAFGRLDATLRFRGILPLELLEAVRSATAGHIGCEYCASLSEARPDALDQRQALAVAFAELVAESPKEISDGQFEVLRQEFSDEEIVELVAFICFDSIAGQMFGAVMALEPADADEAAAYQHALSGWTGGGG